MRDELARLDELYVVLCQHLSEEAAERDCSRVFNHCLPGSGPIPITAPERHTGKTFRKRSDKLIDAMNALHPTLLPPDVANELFAVLVKANVIVSAAAASRPSNGTGDGTSWHAINVVAVGAALWRHWRNEEPRRGYGSGDTDAFLDFLGELFFALDVRNPSGKEASPRNAVSGWAKVASAPELSYDFAE
jgi:hypothetical protein